MATISRVRTVITGVAGGPWYVNLHFLGGEASATEAQNAMVAFWQAVASRLISGAQATVEGAVTQIDSTTGQATGVVSTGPNDTVQGTFTGPQYPWQVQMLVNLRTASYQGGRAIQGRLFLPLASGDWGTPSGPQSNTSGYQAINAALQALLLDADHTAVVYSKVSGLTPPVTSVAINGTWGTLRSRLR